MVTYDKMIINGKTINFEGGHTEREWKQQFMQDNDYFDVVLWDFPLDELIDGSIEPDENILYWYINGRLYETTIGV